MLKTSRLSHPYKGISDCFALTMKDEGFVSLYRGNTANVICYLPALVGLPILIATSITSYTALELHVTLLSIQEYTFIFPEFP